ncbi:MAG: diguanylate cyclase [Calditrichia bacterium]|nr:diguanylate cyclase [Calditrichia bacterium]
MSQRKLLYIEDDADSREMIADVLHLHGFKFLGASRGLEGIRIATQELPDLILLDINLPEMDGYEVTTLLKSVKSLENTPIIAISVETDEGSRERILTAGCQGFISKPINIPEFLDRIDEYLSGRTESVTPEVEKKFLTEYNLRLGEKLQNKIEELEKVNLSLISMNEELNISQSQLTDYNNRLLAMNNIANSLRLQNSPAEVLQVLPQKLTEGFNVDRCLIFEYHEDNGKLDLLHAAGTAESNIKKIKFKLNPVFYQKLKDDLKILWIQDKKEIPDEKLYKIAQSLNSTSFIIGSLSGFSSRRDATSILKSIASYSDRDNDESITIEKPRKYIIFIDRGKTQRHFESYEVRVLKAFLQTTSIIYENMLLYHKMMKLYKIKEQEAITDALTNVFNYRFFQSQIEREIVRSDRHSKHFSIAMIDIDNFKQYNDSQGHLNGDEALKLIAKTIIQNIRKSDTLARYGGDEFVMILPELDKHQSKSLAEKLCMVIGKTKVPRKKSTPKVNLTVSLGISTFPDDGRSEDDLLKKADEALYQAKDLGRNAVCISA